MDYAREGRTPFPQWNPFASVRLPSQSSAHYGLAITVTQTAFPEINFYDPDNTRINVQFGINSSVFQRDCRQSASNKVEVEEDGQLIPIMDFLKKTFPPQPSVLLNASQMDEWWSMNGKSFNWSGLPNEVRENILSHCIQKPEGYDPYHFQGPTRWPTRGNWYGVPEIYDQLGKWSSVLRVSSNMRNVAIRLCTVHNDKYPGGMVIAVCHAYQLKKIIKQFSGQRIICAADTDESHRDDLTKQYLAKQFQCKLTCCFSTRLFFA